MQFLLYQIDGENLIEYLYKNLQTLLKMTLQKQSYMF